MTEKTYVITGVANGIGRELAKILRAGGSKVIGMDIVEPDDALDVFVQLDLNDKSSIVEACKAVEGDLDGLCNSAGLPPRARLESRILNVNFLGTLELTGLLQPRLKATGSVVNLASRAGHGWREGVEQVKRLAALEMNVNSDVELRSFIEQENIDPVRAYDLSKEAIILWTMASSEAYANRGQRMNSISPGAVQTGILEDFAAAFGERMEKNLHRAGRAGEPQEIAHLAAFLLSNDSSWIKGTDISIDGGMSAFSTSDVMALGDLQ